MQAEEIRELCDPAEAIRHFAVRLYELADEFANQGASFRPVVGAESILRQLGADHSAIESVIRAAVLRHPFPCHTFPVLP